MGSPTINGAGLENNQQGNAAGLSTNPQELQAQLDALFTPEMAENAFKKFKESLDGDTLDLTQGGFNEILTAIAIPLAMMNPRALEDSIDFASSRMSDDQLFQMAGVIPEPMQSRLRALEQQGGAFNTALGESNQQINERKQKERRASEFTQLAAYAAAKAAATQLADEVADSIFEKNEEKLLTAYAAYHSNRSRLSTDELAASMINDGLGEVTDEAYTATIEEIAEQQPSLTAEDAHEIAVQAVTKTADENMAEHGVDENTRIATIAQLQERMNGLSSDMMARYQQKTQASIGIAGAAFGASMPGQDTMLKGIENKTQLIDMINTQFFEQSQASMNNAQTFLDDMKTQSERLQQEITAARDFINSNESNLSGSMLMHRLDNLIAQEEALQDLNNSISTQEAILTQQGVVIDMAKVEVNKMLDGLNDDLSNVTPQFLKQAMLNMDMDLLNETNKLNDLMGLEQMDPMDPFRQILDMDGVNLTEEQRAELTQFIEEVGPLMVEKARADAEFAAAAEAQASLMSPDGILMNDPGLGGMPGIVSPIASQQIMTDLAYQNKIEADQRIQEAAQRAGVEAPKEEVSEGVVITPAPQTPEEMYGDWDPELEQIARNLVANGTTSPEDIEAALDAGNFIGLGMGESYSRDKLNSFLDEFSGEQPLSKPAPIVASAEPTPETSTEDTRNVTSAAQQYDNPDNGPPFTNAPNLRSEFGAVNGQAYTAPAPDAQPAIDQQVALQQQQQNNAGMGKPV